jgi:hypothetical protein
MKIERCRAKSVERAALAHRRKAAHGGGLAGLRRNGGPGHGFGSRLAGKRAGAMENSSRGSGRGAEDRRAVLAGGAARRINDERLRARGAVRERRKSGQRGSLPCSGAPAVACGDKEGARRRRELDEGSTRARVSRESRRRLRRRFQGGSRGT